MLKLTITLSTALSSESSTSELYKDASDAAAGALDLAGAAASAVTEQYQSAIRLQNMTGQVTLLLNSCVESSHCCCFGRCCHTCYLRVTTLGSYIPKHNGLRSTLAALSHLWLLLSDLETVILGQHRSWPLSRYFPTANQPRSMVCMH